MVQFYVLTKQVTGWRIIPPKTKPWGSKTVPSGLDLQHTEQEDDVFSVPQSQVQGRASGAPNVNPPPALSTERMSFKLGRLEFGYTVHTQNDNRLFY